MTLTRLHRTIKQRQKGIPLISNLFHILSGILLAIAATIFVIVALVEHFSDPHGNSKIKTLNAHASLACLAGLTYGLTS